VATDDAIAQAQGYSDSDISASAERFVQSFKDVCISHEMVSRQVRLLCALRDLHNENRFASHAIRCWPELQTRYGAWPCAAISLLNDSGIPSACEGDPGGALDMLLSKELSEHPSTLMDIVNWDHPANTFAIWHCGPTACSWADKSGARLIPHNVDGCTSRVKPASGLPGVVDMQFARGDVTVFRTLGAIDDEFVVEGQLVPNKQHRISGSFGTVAKPTIYTTRTSASTIRDEIFKWEVPQTS